MPYEENRETITRGERIKRTNNLGFNEIESESSARRAKSTIPCQAEGSGEDVRTRAEDAAKTDIQERKVLKNCRKITETLGQERDMSSEEKRKKNWDGESALSTGRNGQEPLCVAEKPFSGWVV